VERGTGKSLQAIVGNLAGEVSKRNLSGGGRRWRLFEFMPTELDGHIRGNGLGWREDRSRIGDKDRDSDKQIEDAIGEGRALERLRRSARGYGRQSRIDERSVAFLLHEKAPLDLGIV
jgi:hypothetical protein